MLVLRSFHLEQMIKENLALTINSLALQFHTSTLLRASVGRNVYTIVHRTMSHLPDGDINPRACVATKVS